MEQRQATGPAPAGTPERTFSRLADAKALRAYAHPVRMRLILALRTRGPLTATQAGRLLGESSGTCSFHLRQLAKYGLVEEAGGGTGREKPWQATATSTTWDDLPEQPEAAAALGLLHEALGEMYFERLRHWLRARPAESPEWQRASFMNDYIVWATADELESLGHELSSVARKYFDRVQRPELRPPGARPAAIVQLGFPDVTLQGDAPPPDARHPDTGHREAP